MIGILALVLSLIGLTFQQSTQPGSPRSPCPSVFTYEPPGTEPGRWYGVANLSTDTTLHSLWLNIVLDGKADILGNWIGDVSTQDNMDFKIENTATKLTPGTPLSFRFFVQYNPLNKTPKLRAIRINGREICNANRPQPAVDSPIRPEDTPHTRPVEGRPPADDEERPVYTRPVFSPGPLEIGGGEAPAQNSNSRPQNGFQVTPTPTRVPNRGSSSDNDENVSNDDDDYFPGPGGSLIVIPPKGTDPSQNQCGKVTQNAPIPLIVNGTPTLEGQWPWQIALYQTQTVDNKYICGGTLVSHKHVITAAHCVSRKSSRRIVNKNTLTVYLGKHNLRTSVDGVQIKFVEKITVHPDYNAGTYSRDISILELKERVTYSNWVRPACLWPEDQIDLTNVIDKKGSVVGWGFDDKGVATEELSKVEMPVVDTETCIRSYSEFFVRFTSNYTYCAGYRDGVYNEQLGIMQRSSVCNGDSGGGMVFQMGGTWYLRGLVSLSVARQNELRCDPTHYVIFTDIAKFLPWVKTIVNDF